jgi:hypothetical protein
MTWLPSFLNPLTAAIAAAVAIPLLLILYFLKLRRRELAVPSTLLWRKAIQDLQVNAPFQKLRRNLLLLLQMLLLLLLVLALARPVVNYSPGAGKATVVLIDRSASMNAADIDGGKSSRLDEAKRRAKDLVATLDRNSAAMVIAFDESGELVQTLTGDVPALKRAIDSIKPTDRKSKLKVAYQLADAQMQFLPEQMRTNHEPIDVWVFSDGKVADANDLRITGNLRYDKIGTDSAGNIAIVALSAKRNYERPTEVQVFARLANYGPRPVNSDVQLSIDGAIRSIASTSLAPERWTDEDWLKAHPGERDENYAAKDSVEFNIDLTTAAVIKVEQMNKDGDALGADDAAQVLVPPPKGLSVLLVTDGNYFLEKALATMNLQHPDTLLPAAYEQKQPANYDVIIFDRYTPKKPPQAAGFIYFGAAPPDTKLQVAKENNVPVILKEISVLDWKRDHPILRHLVLGKVYAGEMLKLSVPPDAEVLMDGLKGPMIVLYREGRATYIDVPFDILQSTWPLKQSFPVFLNNALQYLAVGSEMDVRQSYDPGATPKISRASLQKLGEDVKKIRLNGPDGSRDVTIPPTGDFALPALDHVGLYALNPEVPGFEKLAVNLLDANESNIVPSDRPPGGIGQTVERTKGKTRLELWWWIVACGALPLLFIEWWVYTRRVHL